MGPRPSLRRSAVLAGVLALALLAPSPDGVLAAPSPSAVAVVRVNQVGYPIGLAKRAYLMSSVDAAGASFTVIDANGVVAFTGTTGPNFGKWSQAFGFVHALDFDSVTAPGTYRIRVSGPVAATSLRFRIAAAGEIVRQPLANALAFYQVQRDGPNYVPSALRAAPAHLNDSNAMTYLTPSANSAGHFKGDLTPLGVRIDASGGWWDAGDYLKAVQTESYTVDMLLAGLRDFPKRMGAGSATSNFNAEARFGVDWLMRMWDDSTSTLYYQVGIGGGNSQTRSDHDLWRLPQEDDTYGGTDPLFRYIRHRPVFRAGPPGSPVSPNLAGRNAAAFAMCYQVFRLSAPAFADRCLLAGQHIFDLADTAPSGNLLTLIPYSFYPESQWRDDLELGAAELALAVAEGAAAGDLPAALPHANAGFYRTKAAHWASEYIASGDSDTLNLYDVSGLAHYELAVALKAAGNPTGLEITRAGLIADLKRQLDGALAQAATDPFGFGFPWTQWDTTTHGAGLSVMASEYTKLTGSSAYEAQAIRWLSNILGANAWGSSLIVGDGKVFPNCLHHQVANIAGALDGTSPILAGAAVEGPNGTTYSGSLAGMRPCPPDGSDRFGAYDGSGSKFTDNVESFSTVEPAVDLTAASPLAFAWLGVKGSGGGPPGNVTVVTIGFDDGYADQMDALPILDAHGFHATFFLNSGPITAGDADHMTWANATTLATAGNEIAGHTIDHVGVKSLTTAEARAQICGDRVALFDQGFQPTSFAYPFGSFDASSEAVVAACGYNSGRGVSGVDDRKTFAETIPPLDAYSTRTPANPKQGTTLATMQGYVTAAEENGGGWVQFVFHHVCDGCDAYSVTTANLDALLDFLVAEAPNGVVVKTTHEVIGGAVSPPVAP